MATQITYILRLWLDFVYAGLVLSLDPRACPVQWNSEPKRSEATYLVTLIILAAVPKVLDAFT